MGEVHGTEAESEHPRFVSESRGSSESPYDSPQSVTSDTLVSPFVQDRRNLNSLTHKKRASGIRL
jgi:hypothetical protein